MTSHMVTPLQGHRVNYLAYLATRVSTLLTHLRAISSLAVVVRKVCVVDVVIVGVVVIGSAVSWYMGVIPKIRFPSFSQPLFPVIQNLTPIILYSQSYFSTGNGWQGSRSPSLRKTLGMHQLQSSVRLMRAGHSDFVSHKLSLLRVVRERERTRGEMSE